MVQVLTEALTRDKQAQEKAKGNKITKKEAEREVKRFIQIIHRYRDNMLNKVKVVDGTLEIDPTKELKDLTAGYGEVENIAIFDEAQRSWDKEHILTTISVPRAKLLCEVLQKTGLIERFALIYTGQRRLARNLLRDVVGGYIGSRPESLKALKEKSREQ